MTTTPETGTGDEAAQARALAPHFDAARREPPAPSEALLARVMADAAREQAAQAAARARSVRGSPAGWRGVVAALGGWPAMGSLAAAGIAGVWLGFAQPDAVPVWSTDTAETQDTALWYGAEEALVFYGIDAQDEG